MTNLQGKLYNKEKPAEEDDLGQHLTKVFAQAMKHHPLDAFDKFESISNLVKKNDLRYKEPHVDHMVNAKPKPSSKRNVAKWKNKENMNLINGVFNYVSGEDLIETQGRVQDQSLAMQNFLEDHEMLKWAGIDFGDKEAYLLWNSMKRLAAVSGATNLRFCGRIFGTR